jgi:hypothetical protein
MEKVPTAKKNIIAVAITYIAHIELKGSLNRTCIYVSLFWPEKKYHLKLRKILVCDLRPDI